MTGDDKWLYFNMHDLVRMRVEARHPSEHSIRLVFDPFRVDSLEDADLTLRSDVPRIGDHSIAGQSYLFTDRQVFLRDYQLHLVRDGDRFVMASTRDLLPYVVPVIQWLLLQRECSLVHGAAVAIEGRGVLLPGWGGTGKTSGIVCLLRDMPGAAFLGDDYTIVTSDGRLLAFPKALFIYPYHHRLFPHVFKARHKPLVPPAFSGVLEYVRTAVRPTIMAFPALERIARRITPEHMQVPARKACPTRSSPTAPLERVLFIERHSGTETQVQELAAEEARRRLMGNFHYEMGRNARDLFLAAVGTSVLDMEAYYSKMGSVLASALKNRGLYLMRIGSMTPTGTGEAIVNAVGEVLRR